MPNYPRPMYERILEATCKYYDVTEQELTDSSRNTEAMHRRKILIYGICYLYIGWSRACCKMVICFLLVQMM